MSRRDVQIGAALLLLALLLRVPGIARGLWYDEIWTLVDYGPLGFFELLTTYGSDNNHPLFTVCAWLSMAVFGEHAWALRLPAVVFGLLGIGATYLLALRVTTRFEAVLCTLLLAISYHHVWFSQNARGYTALLFFTVASTHLLLRILDGDRVMVPYAVLLALGTYTHTTGVFAALAHGLVALLAIQRPAGKKLLAGLVAAGAVSLLLHGAILSEMLEYLFVKKAGIKVESEWQSPWWAVRAVVLSSGAGLVPGLLALVGGATVLVTGVISYAKRDVRLVILFLLPGVIGAVVMLGLGRNLWPRFFFFLAGFILLIVVRGMRTWADLIATRVPIDFRGPGGEVIFHAGGAVAVVLFLLILPRAWQPKQDFVEAHRYVTDLRQPGEVVMTAGLTDLPYQRWIETDFVSIDSVSAMDGALGGRPGYLLHTLPTFLESRMPELAAAVKRRGREIKRFRGTVGGGDVVLYRIE